MRVSVDWRNVALPLSFALQDFGSWLSRQGSRFEDWLSPGLGPLATAASTWEDHKALRHILPLRGETEAALCGMHPGLFGWENQNGIHYRDPWPDGYCAKCLQEFKGSLAS